LVFFRDSGARILGGGRLINEFAKTERMLAEMESIALAAVFGVLGAIARAGEHRFEEREKDGTSTSEGESLPK
jgi:hypothetical protein